MACKIINLTQHKATAAQLSDGAFDLEGDDLALLVKMLTFDSAPDVAEIGKRALALAILADRYGAESAMIGGAPYLMSTLETALKVVGCEPVYSFSVRLSSESLVDGRVIKTAVFSHAGWVAVDAPDFEQCAENLKGYATHLSQAEGV